MFWTAPQLEGGDRQEGEVRLHEIGQFYGERKGWRMFDSHALTPEIKNYLAAEAAFLDETMRARYQTVIEVGCGYGRYLDWALSRGYSYVGLDIVPWLVELGQLRVARARIKYPRAKCAILRHPAEDIARAVIELSAKKQGEKALIFFPFNCLGNVAQFDAVVDSLKDSELDLVISTFKTDASSTKFRKEYYGKCGFEQLNSRIMKQGLLIISEEGFHAMAYHHEFLTNALHKRGFELDKQEQSVSVGSLFHFTYGKAAESAGSGKEVRSSDDVSGRIEVAMYAIENDPLGRAASLHSPPPVGRAASLHSPATVGEDLKPSESDGALLCFKEIILSCKAIASDRLEGLSSDKIETGTLLRLVLPIVPQNQGEVDERFWFTDLVGQVESCQIADNNQYQVTVKLSKAEPGILEKFVQS